MVFVHGFLSSPSVWSQFVDLLADDDALSGVVVHTFAYESPLYSPKPTRRIPRIDDAADSLRTFLTHDLADATRLVLVTHSQGGLVVQRSLARMLADGDDALLGRIRRVVMYACPNAGSDLALGLRRTMLRRNPQEAELRPLHAAVVDAQRLVLNRIVHAPGNHLRIDAYAGESDGVVPPASARSVFPHAEVLPGDHSSIIRPDSHRHRSYVVLRRALLDVDHHPDDGRRDTTSRAGGTDHTGGTRRADGAVPAPRMPDGEPTSEEYQALVDLLLDVPGMVTPDFRQLLIGLLPDRVAPHLPRNSAARPDLVGVLTTLWRYRHLGAWVAFGEAVVVLVPHHPAAVEARRRMMELHGPGPAEGQGRAEGQGSQSGRSG
ncbi:Alpha/beta hydrolase family protein [Micromonospora nigra]|uniref:Alpha/beta hydrolase family protein n=1 Tax=Micromonospora nigra TaxID=145857 RepID=A0A1C6SGA0_9ACTN|nr:Alpha/beta hydrolase family protein [Micromonospora nigra]